MAASGNGLPSNSLRSNRIDKIAQSVPWPFEISKEWAWGNSTGAGTRVCLLDSGVESGHPRVGTIQRSVAVEIDEDGAANIVDDLEGDVFGHGTACAGIVRALAPDCEISSVRILGPANRGNSKAMLAGLSWAIEQNHQVINMSFSTSNAGLLTLLHELADSAYFERTAIVASGHNASVNSYPWRFASVISVGSHEHDDPRRIYYNPRPPVEYYARGLDVDVAWKGGASMRSTGNSYATAHVSGICALVLAKHPELTPFELKSVLRMVSTNVAGGRK